MSNPSESTQTPSPSLARRNNDEDDNAVGMEQHQQHLHTMSLPASARSRGPAACERCRDRKTKCDFQRPSCGYCVKRQISCVYPEDAAK